MNISNREKQQAGTPQRRSKFVTVKPQILNKNSVVTPLVHSLNPTSGKTTTLYSYNNKVKSLDHIKKIKIASKKVNPALIKLTRFLDALQRNIGSVNMSLSIRQPQPHSLDNSIREDSQILGAQPQTDSLGLINRVMQDWSSAFTNLNKIIANKKGAETGAASRSAGKMELRSSSTKRAAVKKSVSLIKVIPAAQRSESLRLGQSRTETRSLGQIESLPENDNTAKLFKQIAKSIAEKTLNKIAEQKRKEIRMSQIRKQLELRKYLKSLYTFKPDLAFNQNIVYNFNKKRLLAPQINNLYLILKNLFLTFYCVISKPILDITPNKVKIKLFYYNPSTSFSLPTGLSGTQVSATGTAAPAAGAGGNFKILKELEFLCIKLSQIMKTSVVLDLVELQGYQLEGNILANSLGIITDKLGRNFRRSVTRKFKNSIVMNPDKMKNIKNKIIGNKAIAFFTGIKVRLAGRLSRQSIIPRKTVKTIQKGSLARRHADILTISRYTAKNRRGLFCYTVTIGHRYY